MESLIEHFPPGLIDPRYKLTLLPSRHGENVAEIHARISTFLNAFFARFDLAEQGRAIESDKDLDLGRHKNVMLVGHAASVIALARVLAGDRNLAMRAGCCSLSILVPKPDAQRSSLPLRSSSTPPSPSSSHSAAPELNSNNTSNSVGNARIGEWTVIQNAAADFLPNGSERDWGFEDIELDGGEVVHDVGEKETEGEVEAAHEKGLQIEFPPQVLSMIQAAPSFTSRSQSEHSHL